MTKPQVYAVLYIQSGTKERAPINEEDFKAFMKEVNLKISEKVLRGSWDASKNIHYPWNHWCRAAGIVGCKNEESVEFMINLAKDITFSGKSFRAWKKGQFGYSALVTMVLPLGWEVFKKEDTMQLIMVQNGLKGKFCVLKFENTLNGGLQIIMGISQELETGLRALEGHVAIAALSAKFKITKNLTLEH